MIFEKIKSGMLAVLFTTCLILAGVLLIDFRGGASESLSARNANEKIINYESILYPQSCYIGFGGGLYKGVFSTEIKQNLWQESRKYIKNYVDYLEVNRIDQGTWNTVIKSKAVYFVMPFTMNIQQLQELLLDKPSSGGTDKMLFDTLIMPLNEEGHIYIGLAMSGEYYRLDGVERDAYMSSLMSQIEDEANLYDVKTIEELYAPSKALATTNQDFTVNQAFFPVDQIDSIPFVRVNDEVSIAELSESELKAYASKAFNNRYDFLKRVEDIDGSIVYLYGYGDRALKIGIDGVIRYKNIYEKSSATSKVSFKEGLGIAIKELQNYGALPNGFYLSQYKETKDESGNLIRSYGFNYEMENLPIFLDGDENGQVMTVDIIENQVTGVKRKLSRYISTFSVGEIWDEPMNVLAIFDLNYDVISENFARTDYVPKPGVVAGSEEDVNLAFEMLQNIKSVNLVYYANADQSESFIPAWHVLVGTHQYIINIYSGEILKWIPPEGVN